MPRVVLFAVRLFLFSSFAFAPISLFAQSSATPTEPVVYNAAQEVSISGTISQVVAKPAPGLPLGLHLIVATAQSSVDAHLGPYLAPLAAEKGLVPGSSVQMVGVMTHLAAGDVFLVRTITVGGKTIVVRSRSGIPARQFAPGAPPARAQSQQSGGL